MRNSGVKLVYNNYWFYLWVEYKDEKFIQFKIFAF